MSRQGVSWMGGEVTAGVAAAPALSVEEVESLRVVARRLRGEIRSVLGGLGLGGAGVSEVARQLRLDRATVHRTIALGRSSGDELSWVLNAPGVDGLRKFVRAARRAGGAHDAADALDAAVDRFADLVSRLARSKAGLDRRIEATRAVGEGGVPDSDEAVRASIVRHASEVLGRHTETRVDLMLFRRSLERRGWVDHVWVRGCIGHRARSGALPLVVGFMSHALQDGLPTAPETLDAQPTSGRTPSALLERFSSSPPALVTSRLGSGHLVQLIDPERTGEGEAVDVVVAHHRPQSCVDPALEDPPRLEVNALVRDPASALVFDVYLERSFAQAALPELDLYVWAPGMERSMADHWYDRAPGAPRLELLGQGLRRAATPLYADHAALTAHVFERVGWASDEFVGFRCATRYPLWGGAYCLSFDLGRAGAAGLDVQEGRQ